MVEPNQYTGFTIVELVVVVLLLGILASVALPRFIDIDREAKLASLDSLQGTLRTAAAMAHAECRLVRGCNTPGWSGSVTVTSPDGLLGQMYNGFPTSNASATSSHITRWAAVSGFEVDTASVLFTDFELTSATDPDDCKVRYSYANTFGEPPAIVVFDGGC